MIWAFHFLFSLFHYHGSLPPARPRGSRSGPDSSPTCRREAQTVTHFACRGRIFGYVRRNSYLRAYEQTVYAAALQTTWELKHHQNYKPKHYFQYRLTRNCLAALCHTYTERDGPPNFPAPSALAQTYWSPWPLSARNLFKDDTQYCMEILLNRSSVIHVSPSWQYLELSKPLLCASSCLSTFHRRRDV